MQKAHQIQPSGRVCERTWSALGKNTLDVRLEFLSAGDINIYNLLKARQNAQTVTRNFLLICSHKGEGIHNAGDLFLMSAATHEKELRSKLFLNVPAFETGDAVKIVEVSRGAAFIEALSIGNIAYLAYFGHSWNDGVGALYLHGADAPDTNLSNAGGVNDTAITKIPKENFRADAQIRLFGCQGAFGTNSAAEQFANHLKLKVYGYSNSGGSLFTQDKTLGHGKRAVKKADTEFKKFKKTSDTWLIPINGTPTFREF